MDKAWTHWGRRKLEMKTHGRGQTDKVVVAENSARACSGNALLMLRADSRGVSHSGPELRCFCHAVVVLAVFS